MLSPGFPSTPGDEPESLSAAEQRLFHLQRQLDIETKAGHPLLTVHRLFFTLIQCCGSMKFWYGSGSAALYLWLMDPDPDPAIFVSDLQDINKKLFFLLITLFEGTFTLFFKDKKIIQKLQNSRNQCVSYYFCLMIEWDPEPYLWLMDTEPGGPKTYGSYGYGSVFATLL